MRLKPLAAALAASSLLLAAPASASGAYGLASIDRAAAEVEGSGLMDSGFIGFAIVFGAGAAVGALLYSVLKGGGDEDEPVSP